MTHILQSGALTYGTYSGQGRLLVTQKHLFALSEDPTAAISLAMIGGAVGALIGMLADRLGRSSVLPDYLNDQDLNTLDISEKRALAGTVLLAKIPIGKHLVVRSSFAGFDFESPEHGLLVFKVGLIHKGKVKKMLRQLDVPLAL